MAIGRGRCECLNVDIRKEGHTVRGCLNSRSLDGSRQSNRWYTVPLIRGMDVSRPVRVCMPVKNSATVRNNGTQPRGPSETCFIVEIYLTGTPRLWSRGANARNESEKQHERRVCAGEDGPCGSRTRGWKNWKEPSSRTWGKQP